MTTVLNSISFFNKGKDFYHADHLKPTYGLKNHMLFKNISLNIVAKVDLIIENFKIFKGEIFKSDLLSVDNVQSDTAKFAKIDPEFDHFQH